MLLTTKKTRYSKNEVIDLDNGEITELEEQKKNIVQRAKQATLESNKELAEIGLPSNIKTIIVKDKSRKPALVEIKKDYEFNKLFRVDFRELFQRPEMIKNKNARLAIASLLGFITFPSNKIVIDGESPSNADLEKLWGISQTIVKRVLKDLEYHEVIKRPTENGQRAIYFNPFLVSCGLKVDESTYMLFRETTFNSEKV